eukprot:Unigene12576_Nuclearia_a/m.38197 Unigene12576_Nuclearia_a/g.38197  ORF Unigene12576_Nuclearia_a/g.38197 Unigene12576_Nuclearia_a/m.38197 type:complete len:436 (-) Unigene12576_Nuclearia_a:8-1315(-)
MDAIDASHTTATTANGSGPAAAAAAAAVAAQALAQRALVPRAKRDDLGFAPQEALRARLLELADLTPEEQELLQEQETALREAVREIAEIVSTSAPELDKVEFVQNRFMELVQELCDTDLLLSRANRTLDVAIKERDDAHSEISKVNAMKTRLESLCRELQKENKRIKEESRAMIQAEQAKREELSAQFQKAITEIKAKMEDGEQKLRKAQDGEVMREQLRNIVEQYNLREQHFNSILRSKDLEVKLYEAKLVQQTEMAIQEHQRSIAFKQQHDLSIQRENELRQQLETYADKFEQVQDAINKSNEVFNAFKREMEQMTKKLRKMEKENEALKAKCDGMNRNISELQEERAKTLKLLEAHKGQKTKLESLCRAMQSERRDLLAKLERFAKRLEAAEGGPVVDAVDASPADAAEGDDAGAAASQRELGDDPVQSIA